MEPEQKSKKRPADDYVTIKFAVPRHFVFKQDEESEDEEMGKETHYKIYVSGGHRDQELRELLTEADLVDMGIEGPVDVTHKKDPAWGTKYTHITQSMPLDTLMALFSEEPHKICTLTLKPKKPIWYECIRLTDDEVSAVRKQVIERVEERRMTKKQKTQESVNFAVLREKHAAVLKLVMAKPQLLDLGKGNRQGATLDEMILLAIENGGFTPEATDGQQGHV